MAIDFLNPIHSIADVDDILALLEVRFPAAVKCEVNPIAKRIKIPRLELKLRGNRPIAAGWTAQIAIVAGIDREFRLRDGIVLPMIAPSKKGFPVEAAEADIPDDIALSQDEWSIEWYIVDPNQESELLYKSPAVRFTSVENSAAPSTRPQDQLHVDIDQLYSDRVDMANRRGKVSPPCEGNARTSFKANRVQAKEFNLTNVLSEND